MLHLLIQQKRDINAIRSQTSAVESDVDSLHSSLSVAQVGLGTLSQSIASVRREIPADMKEPVAKLASQVSGVTGKTRRIDQLSAAAESTQSEVEQLRARLSWSEASRSLMADALSTGNVNFNVDAVAEDVSAAALNAAAVGTFTRQLVVELTRNVVSGETTLKTVHSWCGLKPVVSSAEDCVDEQIEAPTVEWTDDTEEDPLFVRGVLRLTVTFDTDAGATKTYASGDDVTVTVKVASDSKLWGFSVVDLVKTYNVIA